MSCPKPYAPLNTLKPIMPEVWISTGPVITMRYPSLGLPLATRMARARLADGGLSAHSPTPLDDHLRAVVRRYHAAFRAAVARMIAWTPQRIVLAHGRCYPDNAQAEPRRAFRWLL